MIFLFLMMLDGLFDLFIEEEIFDFVVYFKSVIVEFDVDFIELK